MIAREFAVWYTYNVSIKLFGGNMSKSSKTIIASALLILIFGFLFVYSTIKGNSIKIPDDQVGNTAGNIYNEGLFAEYGDKIYFSNPYDSGKLYSMNSDHTGAKKLSDQRASYINATEKYIFFAGRNTDTSSGFGTILKKPNLCIVTVDGKKESILSQQPSQSMLLVGNTLYFQHYTQKGGENFCSMDVNKRKIEERLDYLINPACYVNGSFYFNGLYKDHNLYSYSPSSDSVSTVWTGDAWNPIYDGSYVYYMDVQNNYRLCRYSPSANTIEVLAKERVEFFNYYNGVIFYQVNSVNNPRLMRMNSDGSNTELVAEGLFNAVNITSKYTYFSTYPEGSPVYYTPTFSPVNVQDFIPVMSK